MWPKLHPTFSSDLPKTAIPEAPSTPTTTTTTELLTSSMAEPQDGDPLSLPLNKARHLKYWSRCLRSLLPHHYTSSDSNRIALAYFVLSAIDLLLPSDSDPSVDPEIQNSQARLTPSDRLHFREWILSCQHAGGGFCGSPTMTLPSHAYEGWSFDSQTPEMGNPGQANIAATVFALIILALLAASEEEAEGAFTGVDRVRTLRWLRTLQREDGSFGEVLAHVEGQGLVVGGGKDMRYCYFAAMLRWMLRGDVREGDAAWTEDIDVDALVSYIGKSQTYDNGIAESSQHEPHSGYAYCALSALSLLDRPLEAGTTNSDSKPHAFDALRTAFPDISSVIHWLVSRQFAYVDPSPDEDDDPDTSNFAFSSLSISDPLVSVAFNGRCNKVADTCYCWWVTGALSILPPVDMSSSHRGTSNVEVMISRPAARRFLLDKTQHIIGGFSKHPGGPPDVYHSYLGLAALATMGEPGLKEFDAALAVSAETARKIAVARRALTPKSNGASTPGLGSSLLDLGIAIRGERPAWLVAAGG
ncbi:terpenoid cyclases/Protein prenyltransferase [Coniochaeta ligniaria NRRL 30616]|uniref:Terpenoid cyclases/Protein prenyltransferase n=1 Tax=Coniochaeta ligniaria NRRL 30616 TaxID=1408157 RepID=A0A1J7I5H3_9PEZI|nr:terpenoid cyclases/Protein prenyltransferase [Coniochaeta ligniaria NRRL 30616]